MKMPNYKPTKWKLQMCIECKGPSSLGAYHCKKYNHNITEVENIPFFISDMKIKYIGYKGWASLEDGTKRAYMLSPSNLEKIILKDGIAPGGKVPNRWWMWCKVGSSYSLKQISDETEEQDDEQK